MSYRQPKYIAPANANEAIDKFNEGMKAFADEVKNQKQLEYCRKNPGACKDDDRKIAAGLDTDTDENTKLSTNPKSTKSMINQVLQNQKGTNSPLQPMSNKIDPAKDAWQQNMEEEMRIENLKG